MCVPGGLSPFLRWVLVMGQRVVNMQATSFGTITPSVTVSIRGDPYAQECFMLTASLGFTRKYLEELHLRMVRQHVSFAGEAFVQQERASAAGMDQHLPVGCRRQYLSDGWFKWRLVRRLAALSDRGLSSMCPQRVDLREALSLSGQSCCTTSSTMPWRPRGNEMPTPRLWPWTAGI